MLISIHELQSFDFALSGIRAIRQVSPFRQLQVRRRTLNSFVYMICGKCRFTYESGSFSMEAGSVAYLPYGSKHTFDILTEESEFYRIDFHVTVGGETVCFSDAPIFLSDRISRECTDGIQQLYTDFEFAQNSVFKTELLCRIFRELGTVPTSPRRKRLAPAVTYLTEHLTQDISCKALAQLCHLSTAQFYDLFKAEFSVTPLAYRNQLLLQRACLLLEDGGLTVTEIAEQLGFETVGYFSRFFKKHMGNSPTHYVGNAQKH